MVSRSSEIRLSLVVAVSENGVIGRAGALPWRLPSELKAFRRLTMGKPLVMGRKTFASLGAPLDGRDNIVVTRDKAFKARGALVAHAFDEALALAKDCARRRRADEIMVLGGAEIFSMALPIADRVYRTKVHANINGDTFFPELDKREWRVAATTPAARDPRDEFPWTFEVLERAPAAG